MRPLPPMSLLRSLCPVMLAVLLVASLPASLQAAPATGSPAPAPPLSGLGSTPYAPSTVARFRFARRLVRPGESLSASISLSPVCSEVHCFVRTSWVVAGAPAHACLPTALTCTWKVSQPPSSRWLPVTMPITTTNGLIESPDVYAVLAKGQLVLDGTVADSAGSPYLPQASVRISGARIGTVPVDYNGYFSVFLPRGKYTAAVNAGSPAASRWFSPRETRITLTDRATANFTGFNQVRVATSLRNVAATGTGVFTATVQILNPLGQGVASRPLRIDTSGPASLVCSISPTAGLVEPQDMLGGKPLYLPVKLTTDGNGKASFVVFVGTNAGTWHITAIDAATTMLASDRNPSLASAAVAVMPPSWRAGIPAHWQATVYLHGRGTRKVLSLPLLIYDAAHGLTTRDGSSALRGAGSLQSMLRWMQTYLPLQGLLLAPLSASGAIAGGVLISTHNGHDTRVLDLSLLNTMIATPVPIYLPKSLPTLAGWQSAQHVVAIRAYPGWAPESGLTYNGFPFLPSNNSLFSTFATYCLQKAVAAQ